jgi:amino acid adenylation domain-containing protein
VPHRGVVRLVSATAYADFGPAEVFFQLAPYAFDASTFEIWGALLHGGRLVLPPPGALSLQELGDLLSRHGVTTLWLTAGLFHQMVEENLTGLSGVRQLLAGGDVLSVSHARRVVEELPGTRLLNGYGPTEGTTFTCCFAARDVAALGVSVPLGRPIANTWVQVVDRELVPVPIGVAGELCVGGDGLARGYLDRPDSTAERFVPDPFGNGERLYRTGDLVRFRGDGRLEFLRRIDSQVKVRGFRIEPGEVESALLGHPGVLQAVVVARDVGPGDKLLVAYLVGAPGEVPSPAELRGYLRERLPEPLVPGAFVVLPELPLTAHGKVDRRALPEPPAGAPGEAGRESFTPPSGPIEERLAGIWADLLRVERLGGEDNFFELGGHSLLATRVVSRAREAFGVELPLRRLFAAPTLSGLAREIESLRLAGEGGPLAAVPPVLRVDREPLGGRLPLSYSQERLWFLDQLDPGSPAYNVAVALALRGNLDRRAFAWSLGGVVRRQEALRTSFGQVEGQPVQVIAPPFDLPVPWVDLSGLPGVARQEGRRLALALGGQPFDLGRGPLLRATLVQLAAEEHLALLTVHHIVSDGWSMGVLIREMGALYGASLAGGPASAPALPEPLPDLPVQFADYALWQRGWLTGEVLEFQTAYWRQVLAGVPPLDLPTDRPRPPRRRGRGAVHRLALAPALAAGLAGESRSAGGTLFMTLFAGLSALLSRYSGQADFALGSPIANRTRQETEELIGFFVNTLALRADLSGAPGFRELLHRVRRTALGAYAHQDLPFEKVVEAVAPERDTGRTPLFQGMFALQNTPVERLALPGLSLEILELDWGTAKFDLTLTLEEVGSSGLAGSWEYDRDLFDPTTIARLSGHFERLLAAARAAPARPVEELALLGEAEEEQLRAEWNDAPGLPGPLGKPREGSRLDELVSRQAERTPEAVALVWEGERLTYAALLSRARRLARRLQGLGVGPEVRVGVCARRTPDLVVALLGVLAAGGAYVPLDPEYPTDRLGFMLADSGAAVVLAGGGTAERLPAGGGRVVDLAALSGPEEEAVESLAGPRNLAYLIYTSGSTGRPKGVAIEHRSAVALVAWAAGAFTAAELDGVLATTSVCFDLSVFELFVPLALGGRVILVENALALSGLDTAWEVSLINTVPSAMAALAEMAEMSALPAISGDGRLPGSLRAVNLAGEPLPRALADVVYQAAPAARLINLYGPSEDTTYSTIEGVERGSRAEPSIGRPIPGSRGHVVDRAGGLSPLGVAGELWLGGAGLSRGYLGRPELTAERFVPDDWSGEPGGRLYRTGDLTRRSADGRLHFLGRLDHQVKIRGFRIELGEIDAALVAQPEVREAVALARRDALGDLRLVAYIAGPGEEFDPSRLRGSLAERLPAYMVPALVVLPALPRTPNGKVDRKALLALPSGAADTVGSGAMEGPRGRLEELLAGIWADLLGVPKVGREASFFALGGHSLLATRVVSRVREALGVEVPLRRLFEAPTLAGFAAQVAAEAATATLLVFPPPPIRRVPRDGRELPLSYPQERLWFLDQLDPGSPAYNMPVALALRGGLDRRAFAWSLGEVVRRQEALRTTFVEAGGRPSQVISPAYSVEIPRVDLTSLPVVPADHRGGEGRRLARAEGRRPFDLSRGPLLRATLVRLAPAEHLALLNVHHIVSDGWSMGVLVREMGDLYSAFLESDPVPTSPLPDLLPKLPVQYVDFALWQREWLAGEVLAAEIAYWREAIAGIPRTLDLPTDRPRPAVQTFRGRHLPVARNPLLVEALAAVTTFAEESGATPFMVLLAGFEALLHRYSGQEEFLVGTAIANRTLQEVEGLIGFFANTLALPARLGGEPSFGELVGRVRSTALAAYAHQDLPLSQLVEAVEPRRDLSRPPLFQVLFALQNTPAEPLELPHLRIEPIEIEWGTAKFDLTLSLEETPEGLGGYLEYATDLFDGTTALRLLGHYGNLLADALAHPDRPLSRLTLLGEAERQQLLREWSGGATPYGAEALSVSTPLVRPTADTRVYVLDRELVPVPIGVAGELCVEGEGLARGSLDRSDSTAERFVPDSFRNGERLYRTGDLARFRADGRLEFLRRIDCQAQVRGSRTSPAGDARRVSFVAPSGPVEEILAGIWADLLGVARPGSEDNFFELGGHSLLATRVVSRVRAAFGVDLSLRRLFAAPTLSALAREIESLRQAREGGGVAAASTIRRADRERRSGGFPLSFAQERLWFLDQLDPGSPAYNVPGVLRLAGRLDVAALRAALREVVRRQEALRTTFAEEGGRPTQGIAPALDLQIPLADLAGLPEEARAGEARRLAGAEAGRGFDLARGPLLRGTLLRLAPDEHWILLTMHHIVSDGWSVGVLVREVGVFYASHTRSTVPSPAPLPELPVQYADFAVWQRDWLSGDVLATQLAFWREALAGSPTLDLPTDRPRPPVRTSRGGFVRFPLEAGLSRELAGLSRAEGSTLFMTLLAAFAGLLSRYTGQSDVAVGSPLANRTRGEIEGLIGFFVNTLVLRADLSGDPTFRQALARVRQASLAAFSHQDLPFEKVVEELAPQRDPSRTPLFQVMFVLQNTPMGELALPGLRIEPVEMEGERAKFDLTLSFRETVAGLAGGIEYNRDLFEATTARRLAGHLAILLEAVIANPAARLADLPLLTASERAQLLREWSRSAGDSSVSGLLHDLISERAALQPDAIAVVSDIAKEGHLSHAELNRRSQVLAATLRAAGVGPESVVGIYAERSPEMVIGLLGILQAGGAYLPLDPSLPDERLAWMLEDGNAHLVLTHGDLQLPPALLRGGRSEVRLNGRSGRQGLARTERNGLSPRAEFEHRPQPDPAVPLRPQPGNPAYVIYTSGSTGLPKGVMISHQALVERLRYSTRDEVLPGERIVQKATIGFDVSVFEIFGTLAAGSRLILAKPGGQQDADYLLDLLARHEVTYVSLPPVLLSALLEREGFRALASLRDVLTGGEAVPADLPGRFHAALPCDLLNRYGPTETTISVTSWRFPREGGERPVPIGRPIAAAEIYLLDRDLHPVPVGVVGELYVGGVHLARGYLGSPELTAERFVPDPVGAALGLRAGGRLYRSGDLARYQADGAIEFGGRVDHQVKIRGFRVELGEIEAALATHPEVREAVVGDRADPLGSRRLVAYVIPGGEAGSGLVPALRSHLEARLPSYMVPAAFVLLEVFPLSPSGKVDRRALPEPAPEGALYLAPRTPAEEVVAGLFADLLKQDRVGVWDDFFELGGHSLLATRLASRLRQAFDVELPLRRLFERPTVAGLAAAVEEILADGAPPAPPLLPAQLDGPAPLSFAQERLWFLDQLDPGSAAYHMPGAFRLRGALDVPALRASLGEIVHRHAALRTIFAAPEGQAPVQVQAERTDLAFPLADLAGLSAAAREEEGRRLAGEEAVRPFDLGRGPLFRAGLVRLGPDEHLALVTMHHIVSDGWSMGVLVAELGALYPAFVARLPSPLPPLPIQYADFAVWQRGWLSGEVLESQMVYWRQSLGGLPPLDLPTDRPRPPRRRGRGAVRSFDLPAELRESLARFSREEGATLFMTLLAGLSALLSRYTGQDDLAVGSPIAGRTRAEVEGLIGFFVNTLVLRADLAGAPGCRDLVARARERTLAAFSHQDLPFEKVVEAVAPERDTSRTPLFQVLFVLQNASAGRLELPGLTLEPLALAWEAAKFDLTLTLAETGSGLAGSWEYDRDLFDAPTVLRLAGHFERLLAGMVARPDLAISELPILGDAEREQVRAQWNDLPRLPGSGGGCLHERIAHQAERTPEAVALVWNEERLTYGTLLARALRLARRLRDLGVGPEVRVGVCARRTPDLVAALLGVLAAGGAYVPLDPEYPRERLGFMLADSGASLVIAGGDVADRLPAGEARILDLGEMLATGPPPPGETGAVPGNLVYLIYTSGSTGRPKGVAIEHRSAIALVDWAAWAFLPEELDGVLAATSVCFDLSVFEIFVPLALGGRVVLAANALVLPDLPDAWEVSLVNTVPAAMRELVRGRRLPGSVRTVNLAGEPLPRVLAEAVHTAGVARLLNLYGPSEDTTYSTIEEVTAGEPGEPRIGRPLPGSQAYGVDRAGQLAPMGVAAELQLGGAGLARGYLGRPERTAERFVPDPSSGEPGARLYRTGDLVRSRPDGRWGFLGRIDHQVKVRGFRIELGEIEAALLAAPGVREAVVLARRDAPGDVRLVAYVVGMVEGDVGGPLRPLLAERFPDHMLPAAFVGLSALPRTPNGKLDRKALPAPEWKAGTDYLAPRTAVEEVLAGLFAEILGASRVGVEDSFFRLGGHSLLATQLVSRVQGTFRVKLPLRRLFETPTVAALSAAVLEGEAKAGQSEKIARALLRLRSTKP